MNQAQPREEAMLISLRSKPVAIALIGLMTITTAALAAIKSAPKPTTDSVTIHSEMAKGEVTLSHQEDGTIAIKRDCVRFPCKIDISSLKRGEYDVTLTNGDESQKMMGLYKE
ncbi:MULTISPECIES: hypothetical protein [Thalassospira]|jgi:hypothetical protein|uniref:hypothetical protein n=1 Tax=Thalassospira TaxID=168934 RepID=UPI00201B77BA|nr:MULTISPECIES: hypothetical protein [Thalassospira]|tara:strand:+ start:124 stop:462 length:339 start_codon:yes stop_codon:yes gene_type:complete